MQAKYINVSDGVVTCEFFFFSNRPPHKLGDVLDGFKIISVNKLSSDKFEYTITKINK